MSYIEWLRINIPAKEYMVLSAIKNALREKISDLFLKNSMLDKTEKKNSFCVIA